MRTVPPALDRCARGLTVPDPVPTIAPMNDELDALGERIARLTAITQRLADENRTLRARVDALQQDNTQMQRRMAEARGRVESALARLPDSSADPTEPAPTEPVLTGH